MLERIDSYSGFGTPPEKTGLREKLEELGINTIYCVGLAYDYCVGSTALDGSKYGFKTYLVRNATKSVNPESEKKMQQSLSEVGVIEIESSKLAI